MTLNERAGEYVIPKSAIPRELLDQLRKQAERQAEVTVTRSEQSAVHLSDEDRELLKQILQAVQHLRPKEAPERLAEPAMGSDENGWVSG